MLKLSSLVIPPWVRVALKALPYLCVVGLFLGLVLTRSTLREARSQYSAQVAESKLQSTQTELQWERKLSAAKSEYSRSLKSLQEVKDKSDADTSEFRATPAGVVHCLDADRVRSLAEARKSAEAAVSSH